MKRKILAFLCSALMLGAGLVLAKPSEAMALGGGNCGAPVFLGFRAWYDGLCNGNTKNDEVQMPEKGNEHEAVQFIWVIILNILFDLMLAVGYLAIGFVIYGGYLYIMSQGDPGKVAKGKKTLTSAIIGTIIALVSSVAVNTVRVVLGINQNDGWNQGQFTQDQVQNAFAWAYSMAGVIAVIFIIRGALEYLMSQGDPGKVRKATQSIIYAVVGLVIVLMAAVITFFVVNATGEAL